MAQKTVDHFCGMGKYSSQLFLSQKPFLLIFSSRWMMTYSNYMILLKLMYLKLILAFFMREHWHRVCKPWHYKIKNTNYLEGYLVGIFSISFLTSETRVNRLDSNVLFCSVGLQVTLNYVCNELYTYFYSPNTMKDKISFRKNNLYLCIILFNIVCCYSEV